VSSSQKERSSTEAARKDERAVSIDTRRTKAEKDDFTLVKERLRGSLDKAKVTKGLKIEFLRPGPGERIEVVFKDKEQADKARKHTRWATEQKPGTRVKGEEWFPKAESYTRYCDTARRTGAGPRGTRQMRGRQRKKRLHRPRCPEGLRTPQRAFPVAMLE
jgi:hypothetical protein